MTPPLVVAALQAPTLLNLWSVSNQWDLRVADFGDGWDRALAESALLAAPRYVDGEPVAVLVCHPPHVRIARSRWPRARIVWALHNARHAVNDEAIDHWIALTPAIGRMARELCPYVRAVSIVTPAYEPRPRWRWAPDRLWTMQSRPATRDPEDARVLEAVLGMHGGALRARHTMHGQGQPGGFLDVSARETVIRGCSGYLSCLRPWAGFGLAQHEMLSAGVPLVANSWPGVDEHGVGALPGVQRELADVVAAGEAVCCDEGIARKWGAAGPEWIATHRTRQRMDHGVAQFLGEVTTNAPNRR